jgi:hypothetical protein
VPDRVAAREGTPAPDRVPDRAATREAAPAPEHTPVRADEPPALSARRAGVELTFGLLGSVTSVKSGGLTPELHVAGLTFIGAQYGGWGAYLAPEVGSGGQYRSTMLGGGLSGDLLNMNWFRLTALAGYTTYTRTPTPTATPVSGASALPTRSLHGPSLGGMASIPLFGPLRLAYRGHVILLKEAGTTYQIDRHNVGLVF